MHKMRSRVGYILYSNYITWDIKSYIHLFNTPDFFSGCKTLAVKDITFVIELDKRKT